MQLSDSFFTFSTDASHDFQQSKAVVQDVLDLSSIGIFWLTRDARIHYVNASACRALGYTAEELLKMRWSDIDPTFSPEEWERNWIDLMTRHSIVMETTHRAADGREAPVEVTLNYIAKDGREFMFCFVKDISARRRDEKVKEALYKISEAAHFARDLSELFPFTHQIVRTLMPADNFYIAMYDAQDGMMSYPYHADEFDDEWRAHRLEKTLSAYVLRTGKTALIRPDDFAALVEKGEVQSFGSPSIDWLGAPLNTVTGTIGVMAVQTYNEDVRLTDEDKNVLEFISTQVAMAIERKRSEELLRRNEEKYHTLIDNTPDFIYSHDLAGRFTAANRVLCNALRLSEAEIIGKTHAMLGFPLATVDKWTRSLQLVLQTGKPVTFETSAHFESGIERVLSASLAPLHDMDGTIIGVSGISRDITEWKLAEKHLRASEARYRSLIETSPDAISLMSVDGAILFCNQRNAALFGFASAELMTGSMLEVFVDLSARPMLREKFVELYERRSISSVEIALVRKNGEVFQAELNAGLVSVNDSEVQIMTVIRDITARKNAEAELISAKERAEQSDRLKDAFIANISHEIRTPLNSITGYMGLIELELAERLSAEETEYFESVHRSGKRLMRTVEHVLNIASIEAGSFRMTKETFNIVTRVENIVHDLLTLARKKDIILEYLPECSVAYMEADVYAIDQALINLIDNAIKFTSLGGVVVRIYSDKKHVTIEIRDTGIGISEAYFAKLYNAFSQEETGYTRSFQGLGLGMALTKRYVELNAGTIAVASTKSVGTIFTLRFPVVEKKQTLGVMRADMSPLMVESAVSGRSNKGRLLVVEDDEQSQSYMRAILAKEHELHIVDNAADAWNALMAKRFDLVLMDISIQGDEDGLQLTQRIRGESTISNVPVVALTAHAFPRDKQRSFEAGCNDYMTKPFMREALKSIINKYVHDKTH